MAVTAMVDTIFFMVRHSQKVAKQGAAQDLRILARSWWLQKLTQRRHGDSMGPLSALQPAFCAKRTGRKAEPASGSKTWFPRGIVVKEKRKHYGNAADATIFPGLKTRMAPTRSARGFH
jgi:hypothetical protein